MCWHWLVFHFAFPQSIGTPPSFWYLFLDLVGKVMYMYLGNESGQACTWRNHWFFSLKLYSTAHTACPQTGYQSAWTLRLTQQSCSQVCAQEDPRDVSSDINKTDEKSERSSGTMIHPDRAQPCCSWVQKLSFRINTELKTFFIFFFSERHFSLHCLSSPING